MKLKNLRPRTGLAAAAVAAGLAVGVAGVAGATTGGGAATASTASVAAPTTPSATTPQPPDPSTMTHGPGETLLTGTTADSVTAAATKAVPGATVIRVETDAQGAAYEAHMRRADGTFVTVTFAKDLSVVATQSGFGGPGGGPQGGQGPQGGYTP